MAAVAMAVSISRSASGGSDRSDLNSQRRVIRHQQVAAALLRVETRRSANKSNAGKVMSEEEIRLNAAITLQQNFRRRVLYKERLHRDNLSQRLLFEWRVFHGALRLLNQIMVFALLLIALGLSGDSAVKRGIYSNLWNHFEFDAMQEISKRADLRETLVDLSERSKEFFVLSSQYFEPSSSGGAVELIGPMETFSAAKVIGGVELSIQIPQFSFTCWVKTVRQFKRGYILRKRIVPAGAGTELACWGWYLSDSGGPELHFGAHDFFGTDGSSGNAGKQHQVGLEGPQPFEPDVFQLLTVVVENKQGVNLVTFWQNLEELGRVELPRAITDCFNNLEGVLVGDSGLTLGQLRFYPRAMTKSSIQEVYEGGAFLSDISTGSVPSKPSESPLDIMGRAIMTAFATVEQSVADQQPRSEIDLVLQSVEAARGTLGGAPQSPDAAPGRAAVDSTLRADAATGREYALLFEGPARLSRPAAGSERFFDAQSFPDWSGTGVTFSMWYRHPTCAVDSCGTYLLSAHHAGALSSSRCWSIWIEDTGVYFDNRDSNEEYHYATDIVDDKYHVSNGHWRHLAYVFDETDDMWRFYKDGALAYEVPFGSSVKEAHCPGGTLQVSYGARFPGWSYGLAYELYDMRAYVGAPLSAAQIYAIAFGRTDALGMLAYPRQDGEADQAWRDRVDGLRYMYRCTAIDSEVMMDTPWEDLYGHNCQWFHDNRIRFPGVCELPDAQIQCPIACKSLQECYNNLKVPEPYFAWSSIRRIEARGSNGTVCLSDVHEAERLVEECKAWRSSSDWTVGMETWDNDMSQRNGRRVNLTDCLELEQSVDPACSFDRVQVEKFTSEVLQNGGDYTVAFWIRPLSEESLYPNGRFFPHVQFVNTFNPPRHNLGWGLYGDGQNGAARMATACPNGGISVEGLEIDRVSESGWSFLAFSRQNTTWNTTTGSEGEVATNLKHWHETAGGFAQCLFDESSLFNAIEVNYPSLVSPIMLLPAKIPFALVQEMYYERVDSMAIRDGPIMTNAERQETKIPVQKNDYASRSVLMAAPMVFTTRREASGSCPFEYGTQWLQEQHSAVMEQQCAPPYDCAPEVLAEPSATMACSGNIQDSEPFFGLEPVNFRGWGFADILFSITDNPFVFRGGQLLETEQFIDSLTQTVDIIMVLFTPQYGITTVCEVTIDLSGPSDIHLDLQVRHYSMLEGRALTTYIVVQCMVLVSIMLMLLDVLASGRVLWRHRKEPDINLRMEIFKLSTDVVTVISVTVFVILRLPVVMATSPQTKRILGDLTGIPWSSSEVPMNEKKNQFFHAIEDLLSRIGETETLDTFLNFILIISLLRIIQCTSLHPRLALLTGTVGKALDDFWHAALLILLMMASFAFIGTWRFGDEREEFVTFQKTMQTEFELMFGEFIEGWGDDDELQAFVVLYYLVMFMLVLNFLLAIIVEAYMGVRREVEALEVEQEFLTDLWDTCRALLTAKVLGWPDTHDLGTILGGARAKLSIGFQDLQQMGMFRDSQSIGAFLRFYARFDFLAPPEVSKSGRVLTRAGDTLEERIVRMMCEALDVKPKSLKDITRPQHPRSPGRSFLLPRQPADDGGSFRSRLLEASSPNSPAGRPAEPRDAALSPLPGAQKRSAVSAALSSDERARNLYSFRPGPADSPPAAPALPPAASRRSASPPGLPALATELSAVQEEASLHGRGASPVSPLPAHPAPASDSLLGAATNGARNGAGVHPTLPKLRSPEGAGVQAASLPGAGDGVTVSSTPEAFVSLPPKVEAPATPPPETPPAAAADERATTPPLDEEEVEDEQDVFLSPRGGTPPLDEDFEDGDAYVPVAHLSPTGTPETVHIEL